MKKALNLKLISWRLVVSAVLAAVLVDDVMPEQMVTRWSADGMVNGYN